MKKLKLKAALFLMSFFVISAAFAQVQIVNMETILPIGSDVTFVTNGSVDGLQVDWGDGIFSSVERSNLEQHYLRIKGKVKGANIVVKCDRNLVFFDCSHCGLSELNLNEAHDLELLSCSNNSLTTLELKKMLSLTDLDCSNNRITDIVFTSSDKNSVSKDLPVIENLNLSNNQLTGNYIWKLPTLKNLNISYNNFRGVYVYDQSLQSINCSNNVLKTYLNFNRLENLQNIVCFNNECNSLFLYNSGEKVQQLICDDNNIIDIDLCKALNLHDLSCSNNGIKNLALPERFFLSSLNVSDNNLDFSVLPSIREAPEYLSFEPQQPFTLQNVEGFELKDGIPYCLVSESWSNRHYVNFKKQGSLVNRRIDAIFSFRSIGEDGEETELIKRTSSTGNGDYYINRGKAAFFNPFKKVYAELVSRSYGYTIKSEAFAIGDDITGVHEVIKDDAQIEIIVQKGALNVSGTGSVVVRMLDGKCVWQGQINGNVIISLNKGIYIVNNKKVVL